MITATPSYGALPDPYDYADLQAYIESLTIALGGSIARTDLAAGIVDYTKCEPGPYFYAAGVYSTGVYAITLSPAATSYAAGLRLVFKADTANTGAVNVNVNGLGSKDLQKGAGTELDAGEIGAGYIVDCIYNGTFFQVLSIHARPTMLRGGTPAGTANAITLTMTPSTLSLADLTGVTIEFTAGASNTGATTLQVNALTAKAITRNGATALAGGEITTGQVVRVQYDGTQFQLLTPYYAQQQGVVGTASRLHVSSYVANTVAIAADELVVRNSANASIILRNVSLSVVIGTGVGLNKLDTGGTEHSSTWYYVYVIAKADGTCAGVLSESSSGPNLADAAFTDYSYVARVSVIRNDGSSAFVKHDQFGNCVAVAGLTAFSAAGPGAVNTALDLANFVPPIAYSVRGTVGLTTSSIDVNVLIQADSTQSIGLQAIHVKSIGTTAGLGGDKVATPFYSLMKTGGTLYWQTGTTDNYVVVVTGYEIIL